MKALAETVLNEIGSLTLNLGNCPEQRYNGAASVSGHIDALSVHIIRINKKSA